MGFIFITFIIIVISVIIMLLLYIIWSVIIFILLLLTMQIIIVFVFLQLQNKSDLQYELSVNSVENTHYFYLMHCNLSDFCFLSMQNITSSKALLSPHLSRRYVTIGLNLTIWSTALKMTGEGYVPPEHIPFPCRLFGIWYFFTLFLVI